MSSDSEVAYEEELFDQHSRNNSSSNWVSILYKDVPIAYVTVSDDELELVNPEGEGVQDYDDFLENLGRHRRNVSEEVEGLDSYDIVERCYEVNPGVLHEVAGEDFEREIDRDIHRRFDEKDEEVGDDSDMLFESMDEIMEEVLDSRLDEFKATMDRSSLVEETTVIYGEGINSLYEDIVDFQREF